MEIERKFLVDTPPELDGIESVEIEQGYLAVADDEGGAEVRLRRRGAEHVLTVKSGGGMIRAEEEIALDAEPFEALWGLTEGRRVTKTRHLIPHAGLEIELDVYGGPHDGLVVAEVEFRDEETAEAFDPPNWFGEEVTGEHPYLAGTLATQGLPR